MWSSKRRPFRHASRLVYDERGLGAIEYVVMLVLVVALGVALWNLFGNDVTCRFAEAADAFDHPARRGLTQCTPSAASAASGHSHAGAGGKSHHHGASHPGGQSDAANALTATVGGDALPGVAPGAGTSAAAAAPPSPPAADGSASSSGEPTPPAEQSLSSRIGDALAATGEQVVDFVEGAIVGANPLTPAWPVRPKPSFGHEIAFGMGETVASVGGLIYDGVQILSGGGGAIASGTAIVATDGLALPVAGPALVASTGQVAAGSAMAVGHMGNLQGGINHMMNGSEPPPKPHESGSASSGEHAPSSGEKPQGHADAPHGEHEPSGGEQPSTPHETKPPSAGQPRPHTPVKPADLGITVRADGKEVFYRTMSKADAAELAKTGRMPATGETTISPTQSFSESYTGVLVEFEVNPGTTAKLQEIGVRDAAGKSKEVLPDMPVGQKGWGRDHARFKFEDPQFNIGLGKGKGLDTFNANIASFHVVSP